ncbi:hypothetical protein A2335_04685 [Candidatus Peregrinibacteria bacterium RIFOXYB2_FULL_32_7]|nr:MAG: hypothetical protein A2335_04685 [Candidatus Peregrinibacteria bacterium RIFOXYB2_FULL_32_7]
MSLGEYRLIDNNHDDILRFAITAFTDNPLLIQTIELRHIIGFNVKIGLVTNPYQYFLNIDNNDTDRTDSNYHFLYETLFASAIKYTFPDRKNYNQNNYPQHYFPIFFENINDLSLFLKSLIEGVRN